MAFPAMHLTEEEIILSEFESTPFFQKLILTKLIKAMVDDFNAEGLKLRYRVPFDLNDWTINVEPFDVLALFSARAFDSEDEPALPGEPFASRAGWA